MKEMYHKVMELEIYKHQTEFGKWPWGTILLISSSFILLSFSRLLSPYPFASTSRPVLWLFQIVSRGGFQTYFKLLFSTIILVFFLTLYSRYYKNLIFSP